MGHGSNLSSTHNGTTVTRASDRELVVTRSFDAPARLVFEAWSNADLFRRWWVPKSVEIPLLSCEMDVRTGGGYRLVFGHNPDEGMAFFGRYLEVIPGAKIVWTNEESADGAVTTVTFAEEDGRTLLTFSELYPTKEALDEAIVAMEGGITEQLDQLGALLAELDSRAG